MLKKIKKNTKKSLFAKKKSLKIAQNREQANERASQVNQLNKACKAN